MQALWLEDQRLSYRRDVPLPVPKSGEALIQVTLAGVCSTDLELLRGYYPFTGIPGHEFVGKVVSAPGNPNWVNRRVVGEINITCGECELCKSGLRRHCEQRKALGIHAWDGAFAEYMLLPVVNLHAVPERIPDEMAVFTEPLAAAGEILEQVEIKRGQRVLVIGAGRLGQLIAMVLHQMGCRLDVVARHRKQRELLGELNINTFQEDDPDLIKYDVIVEATGSAVGFDLAHKLIKPRGTLVLKSTYQGMTEVNLSQVVVNEVTIIGSRCGPFEPAMQWLEEGKVDPKSLIEAIYPLEQGVEAFTMAGMPGVLKVLVNPAE